mgnify:FL=1
MNDPNITRRDFIRFFGAASVAGLSSGLAEAQSLDRYAKLVDTFKCIGCRRCMSACKRENKLPPYDIPESLIRDMDGTTYTVVNFKKSESDAEFGRFVKWQCQHCIKPACAGVCPVKAITKNMLTGAVIIDEKKCIGCRYCYQACPYKVPRFDFAKRITRKCHLCYTRLPRFKPACVTACPVEAIEYDYRNLLLKKARQIAQVMRGYVLGEHEAGGTDVITILHVPPQKMGIIVAPKKVVNQDIDKVRITFSGVGTAAAVVGMLYLYSQITKDEGDDT